MRYRTLTFTFNEPLTEAQRYTLIKNLQAVRDQNLAHAKRVYRNLDNFIFNLLAKVKMAEISRDMLKMKLNWIIQDGTHKTSEGGNKMFFITNPEPCRYIFGYAYEDLALINYKVGVEVNEWAQVVEAAIILSMNRNVFPQMKVKDVKIEKGNYDDSVPSVPQ